MKGLPLASGFAGVITSSSPSRTAVAVVPSTVTVCRVLPAKSRSKRDRAWVAVALTVVAASKGVLGACQSKSRR
ncbi:hypothetical protein [Streptomyces sp. S1A1-7]|uniref:hypothetical protein n=1 Tax=Streptomyces sp. S1A1-7 TaxID=2594459 RepID=UPI001F07FD14|nr:hypothetical protein [Streptomyces sp. S1A1-7]